MLVKLTRIRLGNMFLSNYSGVPNSCRPTFIYKSVFFLNDDEKRIKRMTAMPILV